MIFKKYLYSTSYIRGESGNPVTSMMIFSLKRSNSNKGNLTDFQLIDLMVTLPPLF